MATVKNLKCANKNLEYQYWFNYSWPWKDKEKTGEKKIIMRSFSKSLFRLLTFKMWLVTAVWTTWGLRTVTVSYRILNRSWEGKNLLHLALQNVIEVTYYSCGIHREITAFWLSKWLVSHMLSLSLTLSLGVRCQTTLPRHSRITVKCNCKLGSNSGAWKSNLTNW